MRQMVMCDFAQHDCMYLVPFYRRVAGLDILNSVAVSGGETIEAMLHRRRAMTFHGQVLAPVRQTRMTAETRATAAGPPGVAKGRRGAGTTSGSTRN